MMSLKILLPILCNTILAVILYIAEKKTSFKNMNYSLKQTLIGILFGGVAILSTHYGIEVVGVVANVRDASPFVRDLFSVRLPELSQALSAVCTVGVL